VGGGPWSVTVRVRPCPSVFPPRPCLPVRESPQPR